MRHRAIYIVTIMAWAAFPARAWTSEAETLDQIKRQHSDAQDALSAAEARIELLVKKVYDSRLVIRYEGELDPPFQLALLELAVDGAMIYSKKFKKTARQLTVLLFDGYLVPGHHMVQLFIYARHPDDPPRSKPSLFYGCGLSVKLQKNATTQAIFEAKMEGELEESTGNLEIECSSGFITATH